MVYDRRGLGVGGVSGAAERDMVEARWAEAMRAVGRGFGAKVLTGRDDKLNPPLLYSRCPIPPMGRRDESGCGVEPSLRRGRCSPPLFLLLAPPVAFQPRKHLTGKFRFPQRVYRSPLYSRPGPAVQLRVFATLAREPKVSGRQTGFSRAASANPFNSVPSLPS